MLLYDPSCPSVVGWLVMVGWSVCHNFLKGRKLHFHDTPIGALVFFIWFTYSTYKWIRWRKTSAPIGACTKLPALFWPIYSTYKWIILWSKCSILAIENTIILKHPVAYQSIIQQYWFKVRWPDQLDRLTTSNYDDKYCLKKVFVFHSKLWNLVSSLPKRLLCDIYFNIIQKKIVYVILMILITRIIRGFDSSLQWMLL